MPPATSYPFSAPTSNDLSEPLAQQPGGHVNSNLNSADSNGWSAFAPRLSLSEAAMPPPKPSRCATCCLWYLLLTSLVCLAFAIVGPLFAQQQLDEQMEDQFLVTSDSSTGYERWSNASSDSDREIHMYVFSVENPDGFIAGEKLEVAERGPFVYKKIWRKVNVTFNTSHDFVDYKSWVLQQFDPDRTRELTGGQYDSDEAAFLVVDAYFWGQLPQMGPTAWRVANEFAETGVSRGLRKLNDTERMFTRLSVRNLKDGYEKPSCPLCFPGLYPNQGEPSMADAFRTRIGKTDAGMVANIVQWKEQESMSVACPWGQPPLPPSVTCPDGIATNPCCGGVVPVWGEPPAGAPPVAGDPFAPNQVSGSDGNQFQRAPLRWWSPLPPDPLEYVVVFVDLIARHVPLEVRPERVTFDGIEVAVYELPLDAPSSGNATEYPYNAAYYMFGPRNLMNNTLTNLGAPIFMSNPHLLAAGPEATSRVRGLRPDAEKHQTNIYVEPTSGMNLRSRQRLQVNVEVKEVNFTELDGYDSTWFSNIQPGATYAPLAWFDIVETVQPDTAAELRDGLNLVQVTWWACFSVGAGLSFVCLVGAVWAACRARRRAKATPPDLPSPGIRYPAAPFE